MGVVFPYSIYHLDHKHLIFLERKIKAGEGDENEILAVKCYEDLMSNRPRYDPTIRQTFGSRIRSIEESIEDVKRNLDNLNTEKIMRKASSAIELMKLGFYIKAADVLADTAQDAIKLTTSINKRWMLSESKKIEPTINAWRSTDSYDLIQRFNSRFLKMPLGFIDLQEGSYATELV
tara:strand:- start:19511 stop:20041 length:531 start_codon:yes stop_codon:yes gene_type:complete